MKKKTSKKTKGFSLIELLIVVAIILIIAAIISMFLGDPIEAGIIIFIVLLSVILDFTQEELGTNSDNFSSGHKYSSG